MVHNAGSVTLRHSLVFSDAGESYDASAQVLVNSYCTEQLKHGAAETCKGRPCLELVGRLPHTVAALNIEKYSFFSLSLRFWTVQKLGK
jgi:hypothetical protein